MRLLGMEIMFPVGVQKSFYTQKKISQVYHYEPPLFSSSSLVLLIGFNTTIINWEEENKLKYFMIMYLYMHIVLICVSDASPVII